MSSIKANTLTGVTNGSESYSNMRFWCNYNSLVTVPLMRASRRISSVTDNAIGNQSLALSFSTGNAYYAVDISGTRLPANGAEAAMAAGYYNKTTTAISIVTQNNDAEGLQDCDTVLVNIMY